VTNQPPPLVGHDVAADPALCEAVAREGAGWHLPDLHRLGRLAGSASAQRWADEANRHEPVLRTHDRYGHRVDEVDFHPSWHALMDVAVREGLAGAPRRRMARPAPRTGRHGRPGDAGAPDGRTPRPGPAGLAAGAARPDRGGRRVLRLRPGGDRGLAFGTLPAGLDLAGVIDRVPPVEGMP
jgi:hypothetical protein